MNNTLSQIFKMLGRLNKNELMVLNKTVVELLKTTYDQETLVAAGNFNQGDMVRFTDNNNIGRSGIITKKNQKTFEVLTADSYIIRISPTYLKPEPNPSKELLKLRNSLLITSEDRVRKLSELLPPKNPLNLSKQKSDK